MSLPSNQKKIRNKKRHINKIAQWKLSYINLDLTALDIHNRDYVKLWIDPWYRISFRNPPIWIQRIMLESLLEILQSWKQQLENLEEEYYLKIWIFDKEFMKTQVVVAYRDRLNFYDNTFKNSADIKKMSFDKFGKILDKYSNLELEFCVWEELRFVKLDEMDETEISLMYKKQYKVSEVIINGEKDICFSKHLDNVWIGKLK